MQATSIDTRPYDTGCPYLPQPLQACPQRVTQSEIFLPGRDLPTMPILYLELLFHRAQIGQLCCSVWSRGVGWPWF